MADISLIGKWQWENELKSFSEYAEFNLDFTSNDFEYQKIIYEPTTGLMYINNDGSNTVYAITDGVGTWINEEYRIFNVTGGADESSSEKLNLLLSMATFIHEEPDTPTPVYADIDEFFTAVGNAIRTKKGTIDKIRRVDIPNEILSIAGGGTPIEIETLNSELLISDNEGKIYRYNDKLYQVKKITSLKGLTIKFNEHIEPCPVFEYNGVYECSGTLMGDELYPYYSYFPAIIDIMKIPNNTIALTSEGGDTISYYEQASVWYVTDSNGNTFNAYAPPVIYNFDCQTLNENQEFIDWVFQNAKVYPNFESVNDIKSFKLTNIFRMDGLTVGYNLQDAFLNLMFKANKTVAVFEFDVPGQYTASFTVDGEKVTKTFTNVNVYNDDISCGLPVFSNDTDKLVFLFLSKTEDGMIDEDGNLVPSPIKYNDIYLEGEIEFTKFDCVLESKNKEILSFILSYTTVSGEYHNGFAFEEYGLLPKEYNGTMEVN